MIFLLLLPHSFGTKLDVIRVILSCTAAGQRCCRARGALDVELSADAVRLEDQSRQL